MTTDEISYHGLVRTSPKGEKFLGTCTRCGRTNLPASAVMERCSNERGLTNEQALFDALEGKPAGEREHE